MLVLEAKGQRAQILIPSLLILDHQLHLSLDLGFLVCTCTLLLYGLNVVLQRQFL